MTIGGNENARAFFREKGWTDLGSKVSVSSSEGDARGAAMKWSGWPGNMRPESSCVACERGALLLSEVAAVRFL